MSRAGRIFPVLLYLALAGAGLGLPGLYDDEAVVGCYALRIGRALRLREFLSLPTGIHYYHGILDAWIALPLLRVLPFSPTVALRSVYVLLGAAAVAGFYALVLELFRSRAVALLAASLLAASPAFVVATRLGAYFGSTLVLFQVAAAASFFAWTRRGRDAHFFVLMALLGAGLNSRMQFVFVWAAYVPLIGAQFVFFDRRPGRERARVIGRGLLLAAALAAPLFFHLAAHWGPLLAFVRSRLGDTSSRLWAPLGARAQFARFYGLADGRGLWDLVAPRRIFGAGGKSVRISDFEFAGNPFFPLLYGTAAAGAALFAVADHRRGERAKARETAYILLWQAAFFCATAQISIANLPFHALAWFPFPQLTAALFAARCLERCAAGARRRVILAIAAVALINVSFDGAVLRGFYRYAERTGGRDRYSEQIVPLTRWLAARGARRPVTLTWGMDYDLSYLSRLELEPVPAHLPGGLRRTFDGAQPIVLVAHAYARPGEEAVASAVFAGLRSEDRRCLLKKTFQDRLGLPAFRVWECGPRPAQRRSAKS